LEVNGKPFTLAEVKALPQAKIDVEGTPYTGVRILDLLKAAGPSSATRTALLAGDGYSDEVDEANLHEQSILACGPADALDTVIPGQGKGVWVRGVVTINVTASDRPALVVNDKEFSLDAVKALPETKIDVDGTAYSGVAILDLLKAADASAATTITLI